MQSNTPNLPEWALPIRDEMARAICRQPGSLCVGFCHSRNCQQAIELHGADATAALAEALPMLADRLMDRIEAVISEGYPTPKNKVAQCSHGKFGWEDCIACYDEVLLNEITAIRREVGQASKEPWS